MAGVHVQPGPDGTLVVTVTIELGELVEHIHAQGAAQAQAETPAEAPAEPGAGEPAGEHTRSGADYSPGGADAEPEPETTGQDIAPPADTDVGAPGAQDREPGEVEGDTTGQEIAPPAVTDRGAG